MSGLITTMNQFEGEYMENQNRNRYKTYFIVNLNASFRLVKSEQLALIKREYDTIKSFTFTGEKVIIDACSISQIMSQLNPDIFFQMDRSSIIHVDAIDYFLCLKSGKIQFFFRIKNCAPFILNKRRAQQFKRWIKNISN